MTLAEQLTPALGWNSWNAFRCYDLTEEAILGVADALVSSGLRAAGYRYVVVDDCWQAEGREQGRLRAHPTRFPSGMRALGEELRRRGLRLGLYLAPGPRTCAEIYDRYGQRRGLGSYGRLAQDLDDLADWGVDYVKLDWCRAGCGTDLTQRRTFLRASSLVEALPRPMILSISEYGRSRPWTWAPGRIHSWRTTPDIAPRWSSVLRVARRTAPLAPFARPGSVNDPDMLEVGNRQLVDAAGWAHQAMWAFLAAPLMIGTDLRRASDSTIDTLGDPHLLAINQDPLVRAGRIVAQRPGFDVWQRHLEGGIAHLIVRTRRSSGRIDLAEVAALPGRARQVPKGESASALAALADERSVLVTGDGAGSWQRRISLPGRSALLVLPPPAVEPDRGARADLRQTTP
ncbi:glycoside hydrolase family 27 protein [Janibacter sp. GXQ6167]|uniref:glycoside hydrolase family 27 protein n=1 Tax=Janibacter sp. GXQ6167 TaxID=3240791 RepID=UPI0035231AE8